MPNYPYRCTTCEHEFEVVKRVADIDSAEQCPECNSVSERYIGRTHFYGADDWNKQEYNPAFGKSLTPQQARKEAKKRGMIEVGNENPDKIHKHFEKEREKKLEIKL